MKNHTSFQIGGPADYLYIPGSVEELTGILQYCKAQHIPVTIIGNGSNLLVTSKGIRGLVVKTFGGLTGITDDGSYIVCESGVLLSKLSHYALSLGLTGLEFASGIPGTLGGAVMMNAGAYGGEMKDVVVSTTYLNQDMDICEVHGNEHEFSYRHSIFTENNGFVLKSRLKLLPGDKQQIKKRMQELNQKRKEKQPIELPSAGSTFKRPPGYYAAQLIEEAGLKGYCSGGAMVSKKHAGFVVNTGHATFEDVVAVMEHVCKEVKNHSGVVLEPEVRIMGEV